MIEREHAVESQIFGVFGELENAIGVAGEQRKDEADLHPEDRSSRARAAAPTPPASGPSCAATIDTSGRCSGASMASVNATRAGSSKKSPATIAPPPITTTSLSR